MDARDGRSTHFKSGHYRAETNGGSYGVLDPLGIQKDSKFRSSNLKLQDSWDAEVDGMINGM